MPNAAGSIRRRELVGVIDGAKDATQRLESRGACVTLFAPQVQAAINLVVAA